MSGYMRSISGAVKNTNKKIDVLINGKSVIFTGPNGIGKTSLLDSIYEKITLLLKNQEFSAIEQIKDFIKHFENKVKNSEEGSYEHVQANSDLKRHRDRLDKINSGVKVEFFDIKQLSINFEKKKAVVLFFKAARLVDIVAAEKAGAIEIGKENARKKNFNESYGADLEQHLLNLKSRRSLAITEDNDVLLANKIHEWFLRFDENLKKLMEDNSTHLKFDSSRLKFYIKQSEKPEYTFQNLSSGYSAIFKVYSDLLMRSEYFDLLPSELEGIVFIDEVDAHLHVSLQRLILPFFRDSFPNIQFLVSTHSPFVITSVSDFYIYDFGNNSLIEDDLSNYSYSSVMKGLLGVDTSSDNLDKSINRVVELTASLKHEKMGALVELKELLGKIEPHKEFLDPKSKAFYISGVNAVLDKDADCV